MKKKQNQQAEVILPNGTSRMPEAHEVSAAHILAEHFNCKVEFNDEHKGYRITNADITMNGVEREIKSPKGNSKTTISNQFKKAKKQSSSIILDLRRTKLSENYALDEINKHFRHRRRIQRVILINKNEIVHTIL